LQKRAKDYSNPEQYLWTDRPDAHAVLASGQRWFARRWRTNHKTTLRQFIDQGYAVIPSAVSDSDVDRFLDDLRLETRHDTPALPY
jgi:hypothetical protein